MRKHTLKTSCSKKSKPGTVTLEGSRGDVIKCNKSSVVKKPVKNFPFGWKRKKRGKEATLPWLFSQPAPPSNQQRPIELNLLTASPTGCYDISDDSPCGDFSDVEFIDRRMNVPPSDPISEFSTHGEKGHDDCDQGKRKLNSVSDKTDVENCAEGKCPEQLVSGSGGLHRSHEEDSSIKPTGREIVPNPLLTSANPEFPQDCRKDEVPDVVDDICTSLRTSPGKRLKADSTAFSPGACGEGNPQQLQTEEVKIPSFAEVGSKELISSTMCKALEVTIDVSSMHPGRIPVDNTEFRKS